MRGFGWQQADHPSGEALSGVGAETRLHLFDRWRMRPFITLGAARFLGAGAPDTAWVPAVGGGLSVRALSHPDVQLSVRDHLVAVADGVREDDWVVEKRAQRPEVSVGLAFALGRRPQWRDSQPDQLQQRYEAGRTPEILAVVSRWESALAGSGAGGDQIFGSGATLYHDGETVRGGERMLAAAREEGLGQMASTVSARSSDGIAYVEIRFASAERERRLLSVLQRERGTWKIQTQLLH